MSRSLGDDSLIGQGGITDRSATARSATDGSVAHRFSLDADGSDERGAVEPIAALIALVAVGAGLGLYTVALDDVTPATDHTDDLADVTIDEIEREISVGGLVDPSQLSAISTDRLASATVEIETAQETWRIHIGEVTGTADPRASTETPTGTVAIATRPVTVRASPGENHRGTLRLVIHG